ncbi:TetR/AcrR family transcriptional regulator [Nordella sp. HKS 07]|uniref:TetR/AcrR family transcriptional regulator C-terminal domain-containing protein n=1 Tax=Nordella sp. HKS 07 TaxID=2712222 RepID=UPI0013E0F9A3|nr:TetR/AcrR family transcriptional regulator C-terminal domain-containing protein [Nordella sp. HKS 07]QIG46609.1 TetR/AcrR family transcriptional regulator [Nordella sp. HKS 07]
MTELVSTIAGSSPRTHAAKRLSILDAATMVFCRDGFASASIETIAAEAGVSRQTIYNHYTDKERLFTAVVKDMTERANATLFATLAAFPERPVDLAAELVDFAAKLASNCLCNRDCIILRKLIQAEGERYPELFAPWRTLGPERAWAAIGARFAKLHHLGYLEIEDPDIAARQFQALVNADLYVGTLLGDKPTEAQIRAAATQAVNTFLKAYGKTAARH